MQLQVTSPFLTFSLFLTVDAPKITRHPERQSVVTGTSIAFTVEATGDNLEFLWKKDGKDINTNESRLQYSQTGNASTLRIQHVKKSDQGHYKCLVKNQIEETSHEAKLTVCEFVLFFVFLLPVFLFLFFWVKWVYTVYTISAMCP